MEPSREIASSPCGAPPGYWGEDDAALKQAAAATCCGPTLLKRFLILFWAVWMTVVLLTNVADGAKAMGWLSESWSFASGNYQFVSATTARHGAPGWLNAALFAGVIAWEGLAALLLWRAAWLFGRPVGRSALYAAFTVSLMLWAGFMLADEIFIAYAVEGTHLRLFVAQLVTLLAIEGLPILPSLPSGQR